MGMDDARAPNPSPHDRTGSRGKRRGGVRARDAAHGAGSGAASGNSDSPDNLVYPGERLGLPRTGSGSVAGYGRRLGALFIDWLGGLLPVSVIAAPPGGGVTPRNL